MPVRAVEELVEGLAGPYSCYLRDGSSLMGLGHLTSPVVASSQHWIVASDWRRRLSSSVADERAETPPPRDVASDRQYAGRAVGPMMYGLWPRSGLSKGELTVSGVGQKSRRWKISLGRGIVYIQGGWPGPPF